MDVPVPYFIARRETNTISKKRTAAPGSSRPCIDGSKKVARIGTGCLVQIRYEYAEHKFLGNHIALKSMNPKSVTDPTPNRTEVAKKAANLVLIKLGEGGDALSLGRGEIYAFTGEFYGTEDTINNGKLDRKRGTHRNTRRTAQALQECVPSTSYICN